MRNNNTIYICSLQQKMIETTFEFKIKFYFPIKQNQLKIRVYIGYLKSKNFLSIKFFDIIEMPWYHRNHMSDFSAPFFSSFT